MDTSKSCRCGHSGVGDHPCHGEGYSCKSEGKARFVPMRASLSGMQIKSGAYQTWACDSCWAAFCETGR